MANALQFLKDRLELSGLDTNFIATLGLVAGEAPTELGLPAGTLGFKIPYYSHLTRKELETYRFRIDTKSVKRNGFDKYLKVAKYMQPFGTPPKVYFPPNYEGDWTDLFLDVTKYIIITEGELKAAKGVEAGFDVIGLGGVENWRSRRWGYEFLPELGQIVWRGRDVYICYDSDAVNNTNVKRAEAYLMRALFSRGANPKIVRIPPQGELKVGLDDFLRDSGADAFAELLGEADVDQLFQEISKLNSEFSYIVELNKVYRHSSRTFMSVSDFKNGFGANLKVNQIQEGKTKDGKTISKTVVVSVAKEWVESTARSEFDALDYHPNREEVYTEIRKGYSPERPRRVCNTWSGIPFTPRKGDISLFTELLDFICRREEASARRYLEQWLAYPLKHLGTKLSTAAVVWSAMKGNGKSFIGDAVGKLYGDNFSKINHDQLTGRFNTWAADKQFIMGNEITGGASREFANKLKDMITSPTNTIERKYLDSYDTSDFKNFYFTSNEPDAFFIEDQDRRFFIIEAPSDLLTRKFYSAFHERFIEVTTSREGSEALLYHFLNDVDLSDFSPNIHAPITQSKVDMMESGRSHVGEWIVQFRDDPERFSRLGPKLEYKLFTSEELFAKYVVCNPDDKRTHRNTLIKFMRAYGFSNLPQVDVNGKRLRLWARQSENINMKKPLEYAQLYCDERGVSLDPKKPKFKTLIKRTEQPAKREKFRK